MIKALPKKILPLTMVLLTICIALLLNFSIYGQDGYYLWFPVVSEYLKGDKIYHSSAVIFNGQNLAGLYGELPFWKVLRFVGTDLITFLNLTHAIFGLLLWKFLVSIVRGIRGTSDWFDWWACYTVAFLSSTVINRAMAGHLNLLFGILPFFVSLALIFDRRRLNLILALFALWCSFTTQSYQMLAYHIFYLPLLLAFTRVYEKNPKRYFLTMAGLTGLAFLLSLPQFLEMYKQAQGQSSLRGIDANLVYSYIVSGWSDLTQLLFTDQRTSSRPISYFHEINYGLGAFAILFWLAKIPRLLKLTVGLTMVILILFTMNVAPFNLLAELPLIKAFRVPQRSLMIFPILIPVMFYAAFEFKWHIKDLVVVLLGLVTAQILPVYELVVLCSCLLIFMGLQKNKLPLAATKLMVVLSLTSLVPGMIDKLRPNIDQQKQYESMKALLLPALENFTEQELRQTAFHFEHPLAVAWNAVAQSLGVRTMEGYGHPPKEMLQLLYHIEGPEAMRGSNLLIFPLHSETKSKLLHAFTVDYVIRMKGKNLEIIPIDER